MLLRPPSSGPAAADEICTILNHYRLRKTSVCQLANLAPSTVWRWRRGMMPSRDRWLQLLRAALELAERSGANLLGDHRATLQALREEIELPKPRTIEARVTQLEHTVARLESAQ